MFKALKTFLGGLGIAGILLYFGLIVAGIFGYVMNIYKLVMMVIEPGAQFSVLLVARAIGIIAGPLGAILGYF